MKNVSSFKHLSLAAAASLGLALVATASEMPDVPASQPVGSTSRGLLGENYTNLGFTYIDVKNTNVDGQAIDFGMSAPYTSKTDLFFEYNYTRSEPVLDGHAWWQSLLAGGRWYTNLNGIKPYAEAGLGWAWVDVPVFGGENSWAWFTGIGIETPVAPNATVTPFIRFTDAPDIGDADHWDFGVKGNYWLNAKLALTAKVAIDDDQSWSFGAGVNYQF